MVSQGTPCLGPVTHAGCGAICPGFNRGCYGCFGPAERTNTSSLSERLGKLDVDDDKLIRLFSTFNTAAPEYSRAVDIIVRQMETKKEIKEEL
jgi:hypothetical protein